MPDENTRTCPCGTEFVVTHPRRRWCSRRCREGGDIRIARSAIKPNPLPGTFCIRDRTGRVVGLSDVDIDTWHRFGHYRFSTASQLKYVRISYYRPTGRSEYLHRLIMTDEVTGDRPQVDHRDRNVMDNRRMNLRVVTPKENCANRGGKFARGSS
jgi:hypothetical protein